MSDSYFPNLKAEREKREKEREAFRQQYYPSPNPFAATMAELQDKQFMPLNWIVPRYVPEGVTLLAGKPKTGKSWLVLATALAVARGKTVLDQSVKQRNVLYYALEDNERRVHARTTTIMNGETPWPENVWLEYSLKPLETDGLPQLQSKIAQCNPQLVIIDTLARIRAQRRQTETEYQYDTRLMGLLHDLGRKSSLAIVVVHHVRKQTAEDVFDTISGTHGLTGVADTLVVLTRLDNDLRLAVRGRDCEPEDKIVDFDPETGIFNVTGDYEGQDQNAADTRSRILRLLGDAKMSMHPQDVAKALNMPAPAIRKALQRMYRDGLITRTGYGTYTRKE